MTTDPLTLTLAQARTGGLEVVVYCMGPCREGRLLDLRRFSGGPHDAVPLAELTERRAFRCAKCRARYVDVMVSRPVVGTYEKLATFSQRA